MRLLINGQEYSWADIRVTLFGMLVIGITKVDYKVACDKKARYAMGSTAHSIQHGNRSVEGALEITQSELIALNNSAKAKGYKDLLDVDFDIIVSYEKDNIITTDVIKSASIKELPRTMSQGDTEMKVNIPFIALDLI